MSAGEQRITNTKNTCPASPSPPAAEEMDEAKLQEFLGKIMSDVGGAMSAVLVNIGDKLGLYKAMADAEGSSITAEEFAKRTSVAEQCVREWLANQAAGRYIVYDPTTKKYSLPKEHALALIDENSPVYARVLFKLQKVFLEMKKNS